MDVMMSIVWAIPVVMFLNFLDDWVKDYFATQRHHADLLYKFKNRDEEVPTENRDD